MKQFHYVRDMNPLDMTWTKATVDLINEKVNTAIHVMNHELGRDSALERTIQFSLGRMEWFRRQLPAGCTQGIWFDDRGQNLSAVARIRIRRALEPHAVSVKFMSEGKP